ncbi:hypothetical protein CSC94_12765 [Zhengella mangrovi]|uniref:Uncharacterized protein n=1 Tax=Zhengella mangrovi TaxID=1982044 RepID=A0A2G1QLZ3_9HYPH|nr:hypothetical protein [Zhengella mangrovi]PHP66555.1 hypothetical protein CSC94_12765 [Zhengella mangrovi]
MTQYLRKVIADFGGLVINQQGGDQLKIGFSISKDVSSATNDATIELWNLTEGHRNVVGKEFDHITLEAGYEKANNIGIIFDGDIRDVEHRREGPDIITKISCGDGDKALRKATISKSFPKDTPVKDVIEEVQKQLEKYGVQRGEWKGVDDLPKLKRPLALCGACLRDMNMIGRSHNIYWSIQNGATEVIPSDDALDQIVFLSPKTGLIGVPTITDNGVKFEALLNPEIRPNRKVQIESQTLEMNGEGGIYRVSSVTYSGDNRDGDFKVAGHGEAYSGGKVDEGKK